MNIKPPKSREERRYESQEKLMKKEEIAYNKFLIEITQKIYKILINKP